MNRIVFLAAITVGAALTVTAQNVPPTVVAQLPDITEYAGAPARSIDLAAVFSDPDVSDAVRMTTFAGNIDIALFGQQKPVTVTNFLKYVDQGRYFLLDPSTNQIASSFVHRSIPNFIIQGGGFIGTVDPNDSAKQNAKVTQVATFPPIQNEPGISNKRGTIAMAQQTNNPNSATSQWFINLADNGGPPSNLDIQTIQTINGMQVTAGPYTVFGKIVNNTMTTADAIAAVPHFDRGAPFESIPLRNYDGVSFVKVANLVSVPSISRISPLNFSVMTDNGNVTATISGTKLLVSANNPGTTFVSITATDFDGATAAQQFKVTVVAAPGRLVNLSTRMEVGTGDNALIAGFIMSGSSPKRLAVRGLGPSLGNLGIANPLANPTLELRNSSQAVLATNDNWGDAPNKQDVSDVHLDPSSPNESVILTTVPSSASGTAYTAIMRGANNTTGIGVVEVYDLDSGPGATLLNISTRGQVGTDPNALIGGYILGGTQAKQVLVRAIGPSLTGFGVPGALTNPTLDFFNGQGTKLDSNDDWQNSPQKSQIESSGLAPSDPKESAVIQTLTAGNYTAIVRGVNGETGVGSVEVYQLP